MIRFIKKNFAHVAALFVMVFVLSVSINVLTAKAAEPALSKSAMTLKVGDRTTLKLNNASGKITWTSTNSSVAKVSSKGSVLAKKKGNAVVSALCGGKAYTCKVKVNRTFIVSEDDISIKKNYHLYAELSVNGAVNAVVTDPSICSVSFGEWDGDVMPLTVIPKKKGSTTVKFTNTANTEVFVLSVKVTAVPIDISFEDFTTTDGSPYMVTGYNDAIFRVRTNKNVVKGVLKIYDSDKKVIKSFTVGEMKAKKLYEVQWNGTNSDGFAVEGNYTYALVADSNKMVGGTVTVFTNSPFGDGDGSKEKPFLVSDIDEIVKMRYYNGAFFEQDKDIDFKYSSVASLYTYADPFYGSFDGKGFKLKNYVGYSPIFGYIGDNGEIKNIVVEAGAINETPAFLCFRNEGHIVDCSVNASVICSGGNSSAGLYCQVNTGEIRNCKALGTVRVSNNNITENTSIVTGGICAQNEGIVVDCTSSVNISQEIALSNGVAANSVVNTICSGGIVGINGVGAFTINCDYSGAITVAGTENNEVSGMFVGYAAGYNKAYVGVCKYTGKTVDMKAVGGGEPQM